VGSDSRFNNCLLAVHEYTMFGDAAWTTEAQWTSHFKGYVGSYADRTVATEWGGPMSTGSKNGITYQPMDYGVPGTNFFEAYMRSITTQMLAWKMGSFYWAGLKDGDWYSMTTRSGTGAGTNLTVSNQSGVDRMKYSWADTTPTSVRMGGKPRSNASGLKVQCSRSLLEVQFASPTDGSGLLKVQDMSGRVVRSISVDADASSPSSRSLDLSGLPEGLYVVDLVGDGQVLGSSRFLLTR